MESRIIDILCALLQGGILNTIRVAANEDADSKIAEIAVNLAIKIHRRLSDIELEEMQAIGETYPTLAKRCPICGRELIDGSCPSMKGKDSIHD